jgi:hypothetical protein
MGTASGPYAGPFTEIGYVEIGPQSFNGGALTPGAVVRWDASFTISSPAGRVVGLKTLPPGTHYTGLCLDLPNFPTEYAAYTTLQYDVVIKPPSEETGNQSFADQGMIPYSQVFVPYPASPPTSLFETFTSGQSSTTVIGGTQTGPTGVSFNFTSTSSSINNSTWTGKGSFSFVGTPTSVSLAQLTEFTFTDVDNDSGVIATFKYGLTDLNSFSATFKRAVN